MLAYAIHQFGHPVQLSPEEVPPPSPAAGEILVEVQAAGLNPVDGYIASGTYALRPELPFVPGLDGAGIVRESRDSGGAFKEGDRVFFHLPAPGALANQVVVPETNLGILPSSFSFAEGAALGIPALTAGYTLFYLAGLQEGATVFIHGGSGAVGLAATEWLRAANQNQAKRPYRIISSAGTPEGLAMLRHRPGVEVVNHHQPDYREEILELTEGRGVDCLLEMNAHLHLNHDLDLLAPRGRIMVIGNQGEISINPRRLMVKLGEIRGVTLFHAEPEQRRHLIREISRLTAQGYLRPWIGRTIPATRAGEAFAALAERLPGKTIITDLKSGT